MKHALTQNESNLGRKGLYKMLRYPTWLKKQWMNMAKVTVVQKVHSGLMWVGLCQLSLNSLGSFFASCERHSDVHLLTGCPVELLESSTAMRLAKNLAQRFKGFLDTFFSLLSSPEKGQVPRAEDMKERVKEHSVKVKQTGNIDLDKAKVIPMSRRSHLDNLDNCREASFDQGLQSGITLSNQFLGSWKLLGLSLMGSLIQH